MFRLPVWLDEIIATLNNNIELIEHCVWCLHNTNGRVTEYLYNKISVLLRHFSLKNEFGGKSSLSYRTANC